MFKASSVVAVLSPHTDDGELGCGATISKLIKLGCQVHYVAFCTCNQTLPEGYPKGTLENELGHALDVLGVLPANRHIYDFTVRRLSYRRQEILDSLVALNKAIKPDIVFAPQVLDLHQDHSTVAQEAFRAFKAITLLSYELPWNNVEFNANFLVEIQDIHLQNKINALRCYRSQEHRTYMQPDFIRSLACVRGVTIGVEYAEAFTLMRAIYK